MAPKEARARQEVKHEKCLHKGVEHLRSSLKDSRRSDDRADLYSPVCAISQRRITNNLGAFIGYVYGALRIVDEKSIAIFETLGRVADGRGYAPRELARGRALCSRKRAVNAAVLTRRSAMRRCLQGVYEDRLP